MRPFMKFQIFGLVISDLLLTGHWVMYHDLNNLFIYFMLSCAFFGIVQFISAWLLFADENYRTPELRSYIVLSCALIGLLIYRINFENTLKNWFLYLMGGCYLMAHLYPAVLYRIIRHMKNGKRGIGL